jgi:hypothetical protein
VSATIRHCHGGHSKLTVHLLTGFPYDPGLYPVNKDAVRVATDASGNVSVNPGPFEGPSLGGYGILNVASIDEAVELVKGFPNRQPGAVVEIRRIIDLNEMPMPDDVKAKAKGIRCVEISVARDV